MKKLSEHKMRGFSLIEILISLFIVCTTLFAFLHLQKQSMHLLNLTEKLQTYVQQETL